MTSTSVSMSSSRKGSGDSDKNGGFWRKSSSAIPGRPTNPSKIVDLRQIPLPGGIVSSNGLTENSANSLKMSSNKSGSENASAFKDFEQSVSDAWDIQDLKGSDSASHSVPKTAEMVEIHQKPSSKQSAPHTSTTIAALESFSKSDTTAEKLKIHSSETSANKLTASSSITSNVSLSSTSSKNSSQQQYNHQSKQAKVEALVASASIEIEDLRKMAWPGLSHKARAKAWKILCGYLPGNAGRQAEMIQRKQEEYQRYVDQYFATKDQDVHQDTYRQIHIDIPRMSPVVGLFQQRCVQEIFERILYIWAIRHPASGYVQGINDLVTPFFLVFLRDGLERLESKFDGNSDIIPTDGIEVETLPLELRNSIEADSFWCLTVVLDGIQDNYTFAQPGIQVKVKQLEDLIQRIDGELHSHLVNTEVVYLQFSFRWMNNLLMRELPVKASIRLWDTYLSQVNGFSHFHLYVCAAFLIHWKSELLKKHDFHTLLMFLQNLPTAKWGDQEVNLLVAEAYRLSYLFADAPSHLTGRKTTNNTS